MNNREYEYIRISTDPNEMPQGCITEDCIKEYNFQMELYRVRHRMSELPNPLTVSDRIRLKCKVS